MTGHTDFSQIIDATKGKTMRAKIYYLRDRKNLHIKKDGSLTRGNPIACIATMVDRKKDVLIYAISASHKKDSFFKRKGRVLAEARLQVDPEEIDCVPEKSYEIIKVIMTHLVRRDDHMVSARVRKFAKLWLRENESREVIVADDRPTLTRIQTYQS